MSRAAMQQALEALIPLANAANPNERECLTDEDHERAAQAVEALEQALAESEKLPMVEIETVLTIQGEREPVAWVQKTAVDWLTAASSNAYIITPVMKNTNDEAYVPLYTAPTPRKPLTDEELKPLVQKAMMYYGHNPDHWTLTAGAGFCILARAIERAHGIKEQEHE